MSIRHSSQRSGVCLYHKFQVLKLLAGWLPIASSTLAPHSPFWAVTAFWGQLKASNPPGDKFPGDNWNHNPEIITLLVTIEIFHTFASLFLPPSWLILAASFWLLAVTTPYNSLSFFFAWLLLAWSPFNNHWQPLHSSQNSSDLNKVF